MSATSGRNWPFVESSANAPMTRSGAVKWPGLFAGIAPVEQVTVEPNCVQLFGSVITLIPPGIAIVRVAFDAAYVLERLLQMTFRLNGRPGSIADVLRDTATSGPLIAR